MIPVPGGPYDHKPGYSQAWVYLGWDGEYRRFPSAPAEEKQDPTDDADDD